MTITLRAPFHDLTFMSPLGAERAQRLVQFLASDQDGVVLDVGCGWAELLLRVIEASPTAQGVGVDSNSTSIEHGRHLAQERGLVDRVTLTCADAKAEAPERADAVICIGASQIWGPPSEENGPMDYSSALTAIRAKLSPGGRLVFGEGIWSRPPTPEAAAPLAGRLDEFVALPELVELAVDHGFMPVQVHEASLDEWDEFESGYTACYAAWLAENGPSHPDAPEVRARAARQRASYLTGYRGILGLAYLALVAM